MSGAKMGSLVRMLTAALLSLGFGAVSVIQYKPAFAERIEGEGPAAGISLEVGPLRKRLGVYPAAGSQALSRDLVILRWLRDTRTSSGIERSWNLLERDLSRFDAAIGTSLSRTAPRMTQELPLFLALFDGVKHEIKNDLQRRRPFLDHGDLSPCLPLGEGFSYPSGHATWFWGAALLLADLLPERSERLMDVAVQAAAARPYCALHYPSDVEAGRRLAEAIAVQVTASEEWQVWKEQMKDERNQLIVAPPAGLPGLGW